jgi:hypothetical protein
MRMDSYSVRKLGIARRSCEPGVLGPAWLIVFQQLSSNQKKTTASKKMEITRKEIAVNFEAPKKSPHDVGCKAAQGCTRLYKADFASCIMRPANHSRHLNRIPPYTGPSYSQPWLPQ